MKEARRPKGGAGPIDILIGQAIRRGRDLRGMSQEKLGQEIGITFQQVQKYENGLNRVSASSLYRISGVLDVPITSFFAGLSRKETLLDVFDLSRDEIHLVQAYRRTKDKKQRSQILEIIKQIVKIQSG